MALSVGAINFDRLLYGIQFDEVYGDVLFAYAKSEQSEAEIEDRFARTSRSSRRAS
jgi:hypothetical protein